MSQDKITVYFSSRGSNATVSGTNKASVNYVTNFSSFLDPNCKKYEVELTFLSELFTGTNPQMTTLNNVGLININFALPNIYNGSSKQTNIAKIYPNSFYNGVNYYTYFQSTTQDNSRFIMNYPYSTSSATITLTNFDGSVLGGGNMPHYTLVMTLAPVS